jgi:hypothetical protein
MPGRPRTMAKRVELLAQQLDAVNETIHTLMPAQYEENADDDSKTGDFWRNASSSVCRASDELWDLSAHLNWRVEQADQRVRAAARANGDREAAE